jgi:hypothetical protein
VINPGALEKAGLSRQLPCLDGPDPMPMEKPESRRDRSSLMISE